MHILDLRTPTESPYRLNTIITYIIDASAFLALLAMIWALITVLI